MLLLLCMRSSELEYNKLDWRYIGPSLWWFGIVRHFFFRIVLLLCLNEARITICCVCVCWCIVNLRFVCSYWFSGWEQQKKYFFSTIFLNCWHLLNELASVITFVAWNANSIAICQKIRNAATQKRNEISDQGLGKDIKIEFSILNHIVLQSQHIRKKKPLSIGYLLSAKI